MDKNPNIIEIENEYKRIDGRWLNLHFNTAVGLVLFAFLAECVLGLALYYTGSIYIPFPRYVIKYIISPLVINTVLICLSYLAIRSLHITQIAKLYTVSLLMVAICFVFFSVHSVFYSLYLIFTLPVLLTIVYGNYFLTTVTSLASISAKIVSELFVNWDPDKVHTLNTAFGLTDFVISIFILCAFYAACIVVIHFEREKNAASIQKEIERYKLQQRLLTDELTMIGNRTALRHAFKSMDADETENTYIFVMIDLDNFKLLNDTFGHDKGDQVLKSFGEILKTDCGGAKPFRFGGDEFCILFMNRTLDSVVETCGKIQEDFKQSKTATAIGMPMTASFGIALYANGMTPAQLLNKSDSALYRSKSVKDSIYIYDDKTE